MKKILSVVAMLLMLCMLVTLAPITALAADTPTIVISDAKNTAGSEVEVTVALVNNPGVNRMMLFLQYDTSKLTYVGVEDSEDGFIGNTHNPATGLLKWNQGIDNLEGDVTLATVTFKIAEGLADGETATISVTYDNSDAQIINNNGETVDFAVIPGTVTVGEPDPNPIEDFVYLIDGENLIIGDYVGSTKTVIIAETYEIDGEVYTVTEINGFSKKSGKTTYTYVPFYANGTKGDTDDTFVEVVYIPATVTKIGSLDDEYYPFYGCMDLKHAYIYGDPEIADGTLGVYYDEAEEADIAVPTTTIHAYADTGVEAYAESWGIAFEAIVDAPAGCEHVAGEAVRENETDSTCTVAGTYDEVIYCSVCDKELSRTEKTKELADHSWTAADCETARTCSVCGETDGVALGHDFSVEIESVDPTVDAEGYTVYQCSRCDETKTVTVEKLTKPTLTLDGTTVTVNDPSNVLVQTGVKYVGANSGIDATAIVDWADFTGLTGTALNGKNGYTNNGKATAIQVAENGDYIFYVIYKNGDTSAFYAEKITVVAAAGVPTVTVTGNTATLDINGNTLVQLGAKYVGNATINAADIKTMSAFTKLTGTALDGKSGYSNLGKNTVANLADGGNYIFYVIYKDALGNTKTIFINVTVNVANDKPTIEVVDGVATLKDNGFTLVQSGVKYVGDADVNAADIKGWGTFTKLAGTALNGKSGYTNLGKATEANLTEAGNYVYYVIYKDANNVTRTIFYNVTVE